MKMDETTPVMKAGYVAVIGRPNVGKSTLINALLEQKIAAVSPKPQTTRRRQLGILTQPDMQVVFVDTPGIHKAQHKLGDYMNDEALSSIGDADVVLWLLEVDEPFTPEDKSIAEKLGTIRKLPPVLMALTKVDLVDATTLEANKKAAMDLFPARDILEISSFHNKGLTELKAAIKELIPVGEPFFDEDTVTDYYEKEIAAELVRESALFFLRDEVPHCLAVRMDEYTERGDKGAFIEATFFVERESQKGIVIGQGGEMLKRIGTRARQEIESMSGRDVFLSLRVKVNKNWRNSPDALHLLGYEKETER
jgi:GTPase